MLLKAGNKYVCLAITGSLTFSRQLCRVLQYRLESAVDAHKSLKGDIHKEIYAKH
jgi:hypothetical protein